MPLRFDSRQTMARWLWLPVALWCVTGVSGQTNSAGDAARRWRIQHERAIIEEFTHLLSLPNVTRDRDGIARNATALVEMLRARGMTPQLLTVPDANPVVFGELRTPGATTTIVFYAHYDGQPVEPKDWASPPFSPVIRAHAPDHRGPVIPMPAPGQALDPEARIYARSAADDKGAIIALLTAVDAIKAGGLSLRSNIKFVFDGEEEAGSPSLERILAVNKDLLAADVWLICDGTHTRQPTVADIRRAWLRRGGDHRLWTAPRTAQRPLRQLGAESGTGARASPGVDEG